jgi:hypothetical protein
MNTELMKSESTKYESMNTKALNYNRKENWNV